MQIKVDADIRRATKYLRSVEKTLIPKSANTALNRTIAKTNSVIRKHISDETGIKPQRKVGDLLSVQKSNFRSLTARIKVMPLSFNLIEFVTMGKRYVGSFASKDGVMAKAWNKRKLYKGSFIGKARSSNKLLVFSRTSDKQYPIKALKGPSVKQEFIKEKAVSIMRKVASATFVKEFNRDLKYRLSKLKR